MVRNTSTRWCVTLNNYTDDDIAQWTPVLSDELVVRYAVYGKEVGENGTPHLQAFVILQQPIRLTALKNLLGDRIHAEFAKGTSKQAANYCKKDGAFEEFGQFPGAQGHRSDIDEFTDWIRQQPSKPNERAIANAWPTIYTRYPRLVNLVDHIWPQPVLVADGFELNEWQQELDGRLRGEPDDRTITFVVDPEGGAGKSMFCRHQLTNYADETQVLKLGKRDDLSYALDESKRVFLFDIPRGGMELFQYNVVEQIKDQIVFSTKYVTRAKVIAHAAHVVVFCNEHPDMAAMTEDRYVLFDPRLNY